MGRCEEASSDGIAEGIWKHSATDGYSGAFKNNQGQRAPQNLGVVTTKEVEGDALDVAQLGARACRVVDGRKQLSLRERRAARETREAIGSQAAVNRQSRWQLRASGERRCPLRSEATEGEWKVMECCGMLWMPLEERSPSLPNRRGWAGKGCGASHPAAAKSGSRLGRCALYKRTRRIGHAASTEPAAIAHRAERATALSAPSVAPKSSHSAG